MTTPRQGWSRCLPTLRCLAPGGLALVLLLGGCRQEKAAASSSGSGDHSPATQRVVLTTIGAADSWTRELLRGVTTPTSVLTGVVEPHDAELLPSQVLLMSHGRTLVLLGGEIDGWLSAPFRKNAPPDATLTTLLAPDFWKSQPPIGGIDPQEAHVWLDPDVARTAVATGARELAKVLPSAAEAIATNARRYDKELADLDEELKATLAGLRDRRVLVVHPGMEPFARHFGLEIVATFVKQVGREPSPEDVDSFTKALKGRAHPVVLVSAGEMPGSLLKLAKDVPFITVTFDPIELVSESERDTYCSRLRQDVVNLATAVGAGEGPAALSGK